ncbi:helix-turn-helix transcriptional regulator [Snodgrassella sp. B3088]|uniref:helix-turn-helix domain-containing protein n=1 Tax=Snodgrassella sp. B3088 TaxID=2818038 RepID=UPI00226A170A|nr:helix-turn-helix transcriptional regulator [Snodgrassella sp. B3088]MCX8749950.1 helix-turn-helix transcriptional regulator [Snodgrassella sp. B3088]
MTGDCTLLEWLSQERGRVKFLANKLDKHYTWVSQIAHGHRKAPLETAIKIAEFTNHAVTVESIAVAYKNKP